MCLSCHRGNVPRDELADTDGSGYTLAPSTGGIPVPEKKASHGSMAESAPLPLQPAPMRARTAPRNAATLSPPPRRTYGALDLGTNNCRLLIARPAQNGFVIVDAFSRIVRLGEGLAASGRLSDAAMDRAVAALRICADKLRRRHVHLARSVATEACRRATNGAEFVERVRRETGIAIDIITAEEEARLAVRG